MSAPTNCAQFEEKLSAYLDGQLPADQMAQVAAHLKSCASCSALLEKMSRLDKLAADSLTSFDDAALSNLERKISEKIDALSSPESIDVGHKSRIFPIWQKYIAVAASIAVLFLVGRMAFKENMPLLNSPRMESPSPKTAVPPAGSQPAPELKKSTTQNQPNVIAAPPSTASEGKSNVAVQKGTAGRQMDVRLIEERKSESKDALTQEPAVEQHVTGKMKPVATDKDAAVSIAPAAGEEEKGNVSPEKSGQDLGKAIEVQGIATTSAPLPNEKPALKDQLYDGVAQKIRGARKGLDFNVDTGAGPLQSSYVQAINANINRGPEKEGHRFAARSPISPDKDTLAAVNALLQTLQDGPVPTNLQDSLKVLYLQSCAHYDIYRLSRQQEHYAAGVRMRDSLQKLTIERIDTTAATAYLKAYLQEIEKLQFAK